MAKAKIRVGLDFDGVVAYNPFRIVRAPVKWFKRTFFKQKKVKFLVPHSFFAIAMWKLMHESSVFPSRGVELLKQMTTDPKYEFYLITARYSFLRDNLDAWLLRNNLQDAFVHVYSNMEDKQPHTFKEEMVKKLKLDVFVEDNWDIVDHLSRTTNAKVGWIYNLFDRNKPYIYKFPYLEKALQELLS